MYGSNSSICRQARKASAKSKRWWKSIIQSPSSPTPWRHALASQLAIAGGKGNSAYIAAKGAIISLTRTMALDFAADGIRVNAIAPGVIDTPMLRRSFARHADPEPVREASKARHAMKRFGQAEEVAEAALHLASDASSFTTGTLMVVDGGWLAA